ncbi:uncharacterized protein LOC143080149 isoform X2 [Mytilus galloprovincialis]|uniref:uncharacterized protein LOC143080149 isoform X2 n=1 Tax=Mytilus galloprovincialis TaxID=29158 RepID=UPI003F7C248C
MRDASLFLAAMIISGIFSFEDRDCMCLTWKLKNRSLVLTCKIPNLKLPVDLFDPWNNEQGYCLSPIPTINCHPHFKNVSIYQNIDTNETVFIITGNIDQRLNGNWTCRHGNRVESRTVEVTLSELTEKKTIMQYCWSLLLVWTITGFVLFYILTQLFIYTLFSPCMRSCSENSCLAKLGENISQGRKYLLERISNHCTHEEDKRDFSRKVIKGMILCLLLVLMVGIPVIVGLSEKGMCSGHLSFIPVGFLFGFIVRMLRMNERGTEGEQNIIKECFSFKCQKEQGGDTSEAVIPIQSEERIILKADSDSDAETVIV